MSFISLPLLLLPPKCLTNKTHHFFSYHHVYLLTPCFTRKFQSIIWLCAALNLPHVHFCSSRLPLLPPSVYSSFSSNSFIAFMSSRHRHRVFHHTPGAASTKMTHVPAFTMPNFFLCLPHTPSGALLNASTSWCATRFSPSNSHSQGL